MYTFSHVIFGEIIVAVYAQIDLLWLFLRPKILLRTAKAIRENEGEIETRFSLRIPFKYVPTDADPADMITQVISITKR